MNHRVWIVVAIGISLIVEGCSPAAEPDSVIPARPAVTSAPLVGHPPASDSNPDDCTRVVAPDGDDANPGTADQPWATLDQAAGAAQPGDVICFRGGGYATGGVTLTTSGTSEGPITFTAYPGELPIFNGQGEATGIFDFEPGASYIRLSGFTLTNFTIWAISLPGENRHITLDHLDIGGGEAAIHFTLGNSGEDPEYGPVEDVVVEDSFLHDPIYTALDCTPGPCNNMIFRRLEIAGAGLSGESFFGADALAVERGYPLLVEDCYIHDNGGDGIDLNSRDRQGNVTDVLVRRNQVVRNHLQAIKLWSGGRMENNVVWGQGINPVVLGIYPGHFEVVNNTIAYNMYDASFSQRDYTFVAAYPETGSSAPITLALVNNIFAFNTGPDFEGPTGLYFGEGVSLVAEDGNLYYSREDCEIEANNLPGRDDPCVTRPEIESGAWNALTGGALTGSADPLFVSGWSSVDLHLRAGSPAIDHGVSDYAPPDDADRRPRTSAPDAGAYEAGS